MTFIICGSSKVDKLVAFKFDGRTIKTINITNMKVAAPAKPKLWSPSNFDVSLSYTQTINTSPTVAENKVDKYRGAIGYSFQTTTKYIEPFKKLIIWQKPVQKIKQLH